jgi:hypothetical protein
MIEDNYIPVRDGDAGPISPSYTKCSGTKGGDTSRKLSGKVRSRAGGQSAQYSSDNIAVASAGGLYGEGRFGYAEMEREQPKAEFDMGTEWGRKERSRVKTIPFDKGVLACSIDIYYASREALIAMGVPIYTALSSNLPQSFPDKYAQPPKGWVG